MLNQFPKFSDSKSSQLDLEPFRDLENFQVIRESHIRIGATFSLRNHQLKCARRSCYLPSRFLSWRIKIKQTVGVGFSFQGVGTEDPTLFFSSSWGVEFHE
ncbi:unnamed protein product [Arabis nemorensis]|uniref:Uncharacterized protein n=1 Tax=Arabis nemorensis TaxID=586526 RepID=A0A565B9X2_9BRAS|nr:unnamed protein product [Arabis nemorensis]